MGDEAKVIPLPFRPFTNKLDAETLADLHAIVADGYLQVIADAEECGVDPLPMVKALCAQLKGEKP